MCQACAAQPVDPPKYGHGVNAYMTSTLSEDGDIFVHEGDIPGHHRPPPGAVYDDPGDYDNEEDGGI